MIDPIAKSALAWLLTYAAHSTLLLSAAWLISRRVALNVSTRDLLWKVALVGGVITSLAQTQLGVRPVGSVSLATRATPIDVSAKNAIADKGAEPSAAPDAEQKVSDSPTAGTGSELTGPSGVSRLSTESMIVIAWGALALVLAAVYVGRRLILFGRLANRHPIADGPLPAMLDQLRREVGHRPSIALTSVNTISSPVALGLRGGEICLPEAVLTQLEPAQQRGLLAHELAHLVRRDPLWLYTASLMESIFFFQPLNRLARAELQRNAEYLCDDWAAARTGSGLPLAECLARVAEWIESSPLGVPVAGMAEQRSLLVTRVARLIEGKRSGSRMSTVAFGVVATILLATVTAAAPGVKSYRLSVAPALPHILTHNASASGAPQQELTPADSAVVAALIERLKDADAGVRRAAASSLGNLKARRAVTPLIEALGDRNKDVRSAVVDALANIEDPAAIPAISKLLSDESPDVREHALNALGNFSDALTVAQVLPALRDARASVRAKAADILGEIGDHAAVTPLLRMLGDQSAEVRHQTIHALEHLQDRSVAPSIMPLLRDPDADVRSSALSALREMNAALSESDVTAALKDSNADVRKEALHYVKDKPSSSLIPILRALLEDPDSGVREETIDALSEIRDPVARGLLRDALKSTDPKVRRRAAEALGNRP